jgi:hypothetical protein
VKPFAVRDITDFRAPTPPDLTSDEYEFALEEVAALGGDDITTPSVRTSDETEIALYWSYNGSPLMGTPPRLYNQMARVIAEQEGNEVHENARLFALLNLALADAGISAWDTKYHYAYWRPILGIRNALDDGNPDTDAYFDPGVTVHSRGAAESVANVEIGLGRFARICFSSVHGRKTTDRRGDLGTDSRRGAGSAAGGLC